MGSEFLDQSFPYGLKAIQCHAIDRYEIDVILEEFNLGSCQYGVDQGGLTAARGAGDVQDRFRHLGDRARVDEFCDKVSDELPLGNTTSDLGGAVTSRTKERASLNI